ncbi:hypothetical protein I7I53_06978 [Histoplasma capsulatum var. duboisii H88]|uniref:Uncharacterized protein n=1 Tax=Ajellomyces capsulatus (strain H88) TaxID=544711 RepID=A0A8A1LG48_AJEC8|nr:hypothetical protein I7I53_06978 [Histoplasma capsulatum var. duboisii H88]
MMVVVRIARIMNCLSGTARTQCQQLVYPSLHSNYDIFEWRGFHVYCNLLRLRETPEKVE